MTKQFFIDNIGKNVYRTPQCMCKTCRELYKDPIYIIDDGHAQFLWEYTHACQKDDYPIFWATTYADLETMVKEYFASPKFEWLVLQTHDPIRIFKYKQALKKL